MKIGVVERGKGEFRECVSYHITELKNFDIRQIAFSGQAFRFTDWMGTNVCQLTDEKYRANIEIYCIVAHNEYCEICPVEDGVEIACTGNINQWLQYLDIIDCYGVEIPVYGMLESKILDSQDEPLKEAVKHANGIRILHQDFLETGISFITSCANNIPRISQLISQLCKAYGNFIIRHIDDYEVSYWTFPSIDVLRKVTEEDLRKLGFGFRAVSIVDFIHYYAALPLDYVPSFKDLQTIKGIGPKVANCILLYSFHDLNRVPMDVWMKKFQTELYDGELPWDEFSPYQGICQQYLYYHYRNK